MTPAARAQAAIEILEGLNTSAMPADRFIRDWFRTRRYAGSKDRAGVAERVYDVFRHRASYAWRMQSETPRALVIASALKDGDVDALFSGGGYGPAPLSDNERAHVQSPPPGDAPLFVAYEFPQFLEAELTRSLGDTLAAEMEAMQTRAPVDLRVNTLKASRDDVLARLHHDNVDANPTPYAPHGIRIASQDGLAILRRHAAFEQGLFEFQDEAAQIAVELAQAEQGMRVLDLAAGAGGKALALAAEMGNRGTIVASDIDYGRLRQIEPRAERAGVSIISMGETDVRAGNFDLVFIDAPCSGSGTWRRQPEQKWRLTQARLDELVTIQDGLLDEGAVRVRTGGRLVYATCSLLRIENEDRIEAFCARHPDFTLKRADAIWQGAVPPGLGEFLRATPAATGTDGFFASVLQRSGT